jgi:GR25 family glycosyltransferase involved in LPS biosynthesis
MEKKYNYDYYVIHLCKDINRINNVNNLSKKIGQEINIFKGVDASTFNNNDYLSIIKNYSNELKINMKPKYPGIIGCYLSHYLLYKQLESSDLDYAVILEDDSNILIDNIDEKIDLYLNMNKTFDFLFLGYNSKCGKQYDSDLYYINNNTKTWGFHGYIINIKSIPKILENNKIIEYEIDIQIFSKIIKNIFNAYFIYPKMINQHEFNSLIRPSTNNKNIKRTISNKMIKQIKSSKMIKTNKPIISSKMTKTNKPIISSKMTKTNKPIISSKMTKTNKPIISSKIIKPIISSKMIKPIISSKIIKPIISSKMIKPIISSKMIKPVKTNILKILYINNKKI